MSMIPCTDPCIYQREGCCTLRLACSCGVPGSGGSCVHFLPAGTSEQDRKRLPDVPHRDELQSLRPDDGLPPVAFGQEALGEAQPPDL